MHENGLKALTAGVQTCSLPVECIRKECVVEAQEGLALEYLGFCTFCPFSFILSAPKFSLNNKADLFLFYFGYSGELVVCMYV